jgi:hypothetical protein
LTAVDRCIDDFSGSCVLPEAAILSFGEPLPQLGLWERSEVGASLAGLICHERRPIHNRGLTHSLRKPFRRRHEVRVVHRAIARISGGVQVDETRDPLRVLPTDRGQLAAGHRVASQHGLIQIQGFKHRENVFSEPLILVSSRRTARTAETTACDSVDMTALAQLGCEVIEDVRRIPPSASE